MTSAYKEARARGGLGPVSAALLYDTVRSVARIRSFPPPSGYGDWTTDAIQDVAHDFLTHEEGRTDRFALVLLKATDDESFERLLETAIRNFIISLLRRTDDGAAMRALRRIVDADPAVDEVPAGQPGAGAWCLPQHVGRDPYAGDPALLVEAAFAVEDIRRARWRTDSVNRAPIAEADSLRRIVLAVLAAAGAPVLRGQMLEVVLERLPPVEAPSVVELDDDTENAQPVELPDPDAAEAERLAVQVARQVWDDLTTNQRLIVPFLATDASVRDIAAETGLSKSTAQRAMTRAKEVLVEHLSDRFNPEPIVAELLELLDAARKRGTERAGLAFTQDEED